MRTKWELSVCRFRTDWGARRSRAGLRLPPVSLRAKPPRPSRTAMSLSQQMKKGLCLRSQEKHADPGTGEEVSHGRGSQDRPLSGTPDRGSWLEPGLARLPAHGESVRTSRSPDPAQRP